MQPLQPLLGILGVALVVLTLVDLLWTTLWVDGSAGPITGRVSTWLWRAGLPLGRRGHHRTLTLFGPGILVLTVVVWIVLVAAGWVLLFSSDRSALMVPGDDDRVSTTGRIWFVAYTMFTVGNGDFAPPDGPWQIAASLVGGSGLFVATLSITYLLSVISAVVDKRALADQVCGLGNTSQDLVLAGWNGRDLHSLDRHLADLSSQLGTITEQYLSYPVLQYYHAASPQKSPVRAVAILDDALTLMTFGVEETARPEPATLRSARSAVESFLEDTRTAAAVTPAPDPPPPPPLHVLRRHGIPTVGDDEFQARVGDLRDRRRELLGLVNSDAWDWSA